MFGLSDSREGGLASSAVAARTQPLVTALVRPALLALALVTFRRRDDFILGLDESYYKN